METVLSMESSLEETFKKLQIMKQKNQADFKTKIKYNGYVLPLGAYKNLELFMISLGSINNYYDMEDENSINYIRKSVFATTKKMNYDEKMETLFGWDKYFKQLRGDELDLFNREIILDLTFDDKNNKVK